MPIRTHLSSKSGGKSGGCQRGGRGAARSSASRRGGSKRRRSLTQSAKLDIDELGYSSASSVDSSGSYLRQTQSRSGARSGTRSRTAASDSSSLSQSGGLDPSIFTNISSGSDAVFRRYESMMKSMSSPSGDHARWPQQRKPKQRQQPDGISSASAQPQHHGDRSFNASRPCSRHRRNLHSSARNTCGSGVGGSGRGGSGSGGGGGNGHGGGGGGGGACGRGGGGGGGDGRCSGEEGGGNRRSGGVRQRLSSPSGSYTRSGETSSQVYQAALSPLTTASSDEQSINSASNRCSSKSQVARLAVRDANTSNRQQSTRRRGAMRESPPQSSPQQGHRLPPSGMRSSRHQFSKPQTTQWNDNFSNQNEIYDQHSRKREEPKDKKCSKHSEKIRSNPTSEQHQQRKMLHSQKQPRLPHDPQSDSIYSGNHVESDVLKRNKSLQRLYSLRSRRYDGTGRRQKSEDRREEHGLLSENDSDCEELSPKAWQSGRSRQQQPPQQEIQLPQISSQRHPLPKKNKPPTRSGKLRGDEYLYDAYRSNIYNCEDALTNQRTDESSRHRSWLPRSTPTSWQPGPPALDGDFDIGDAGEVPRGISGDDAQYKRRQAGRLDRQDKVDVYDTFEKLDSRSKRRNFAFQSNQSSDEEDAWRPPPSPSTADYREGPGPESWINRRGQKAGAVEPASRHWCNSGRMRETRSRRQTLFSCPYVSLSLQAKTYECDRCAGYLPCTTNNLNCDPNQEDSASQDSAAAQLEPLGVHAAGRRAQRAGRDPLGRCQKLERTEHVRRRKRDISSNSID